MKRFTFLIFGIVIIGGLLGGCSNSTQVAPDQIVKKERIEKDVVYQRNDLTKLEREKRLLFKIYGDGDNIPKWIKEPRLGSKEFKILVVGTADYIDGPKQLKRMKRYALSEARNELANLLKIVVKIKNYEKNKDTTIGNEVQYREAIDTSINTNVDIPLSYTYPLKYTITEDGRLHYLVALAPEQLKKWLMDQSLSKKEFDDTISKVIKFDNIHSKMINSATSDF